MFALEKEAVERALRGLEKALRGNLIAVIAFGSRVRGDFTEDSDFDVLVVVKERSFELVKRINGVFGREEEKTFTPFSVVIKTKEAFDKERAFKTAFYKNIRRDGVVFYGRA